MRFFYEKMLIKVGFSKKSLYFNIANNESLVFGTVFVI